MAIEVDAPTFRLARPVWLSGRERQMNECAGFRAIFNAPDAGHVTLRLTASNVYRAWLNGTFLGYGPARGPHGMFRVDEYALDDLLRAGQNLLAIEVLAHNVNSYDLLDQPALLLAEMLGDGDVLLASGRDDDFVGVDLNTQRYRRVARYSFQRSFSEAYRMGAEANAWREQANAPIDPLPLTAFAMPRLLPRRVPYPRYDLRQPIRHVATGTIQTGIPVKTRRDWWVKRIGPTYRGFREEELEVAPFLGFQGTRTRLMPDDRPYDPNQPISLPDHGCIVLDLGTNLSGFLGLTVECDRPAQVAILFDELLTDGDVDWLRMNCGNVITWDLEAGRHGLETLEPYTLRYLKLVALGGACRIERVVLREYANPDTTQATFAAADPGLNRIFAAAVETYRQNAVDLLTDCPSRERGGYLCDSFFTARAAIDLSGSATLERAFLENFILPDRFDHLPDGMLPMCHPADHDEGLFIPQWAMWYFVELAEYAQRTDDHPLTEPARPRAEALLQFFEPFVNADGLLENLPGWRFIEWSKANDFTAEVNYPTNMLFAGMLDALGRLYDRPDWTQRAAQVRETIRRQSFDGRFFVDQSIRKDGALVRTTNRTEVCQYYAFFFDIATPQSHPGLWQILRDDFGPQRAQTRAHPDIHPANAFIGNVLRLELLSRAGLTRQLIRETQGYLLKMADRTGTLWENDQPTASCNHGFASHAAHVLYRDVLGLYDVDRIRRRITLRFCDNDLAWCEGRMPVPGGFVSLRWWRENGNLRHRIDVPAGYAVTILPTDITTHPT